MPPGMAEVTAAAALRLQSQQRLRQMQIPVHHPTRSRCRGCSPSAAAATPAVRITISGGRRGLWFSVTVELARAVYLKLPLAS